MKLAVFVAALTMGAQAQEFVHGDECLFCHRRDIGLTWQKNSHGVTMRQREDAPDLIALLQNEPKLKSFAAQVTHTLGSRNHIRYLKQAGYGKQEILSVRADLDKDRKVAHWEGLDKPEWQKDKFGAQCAGCHATAVDPATKAYSEVGIDCYACHGLVDLQHSTDTSKIFLSKKRRSDALAVTSTCAQCHLRGGKSKSTGLPYPANFTAGEDLFKDYEVDWTKADDPSLNAGDRHVWKNVRDVVKNGGDTTCLSCHRVHANSSDKHRRVLTSAICQECHNAEGPKKAVKTYTVHSALCEY
jgi:predicted CXXCH cytochrome family protein